MKKILLLIVVLVFQAGCDNSPANESMDGVEEWDHSTSYTFSGTASERETSFQSASDDLQLKINALMNTTEDSDVKEKLEEAKEKIAEAREKLLKADRKSIEGNTEDAIEKTEEAREKLDEAREKYIDALEKLE